MGAVDLNIGYGMHLKMESMKGPCQRPAYVTVHNRMKPDNLNRKTAVVWRPISKAQLHFHLPGCPPFHYTYSSHKLELLQE